MIVDFNSVLKDPYGESVKDQEGKETVLATVAINALQLGHRHDAEEPGTKKLERFNLACAIAKAEKAKAALELKAEEVTLIKERIAKLFINAGLVGAAWILLDPAEKPSA